MLSNKISELTDFLAGNDPQQSDSIGDPTTITDSDLFERIFDQTILERFEREDVLDMYYIWNIFGKGLRAARFGYMSTSKMYFDRGKQMLQDKTAEGTPIYDFINMYALPNHAYYLYKTKEYQQANNLLDQLLETLERYEEDIPILHMGKIQQFHNFSRMHFKRGNHDAGMKTVSDLLSYMMAYQQPDFEGAWSTAHLDRTPALLKFDMVHQIFSEMVHSILLYFLDTEEDAFYKSFDGLLKLEERPKRDGALNKHFWNWLEAKKSFFEGRLSEGVEQTLNYLRTSGQEYNYFQLSLLRSAFKSAKEQAQEKTPALIDGIVHYGTEKMFLPPEIVGKVVDTKLTSEIIKTFRAPLC
ncbi:MAG: hypothetical protein AAGG75_02710 [Bacteroidota bacterium]